jgi:hypothetical protein
VILQAVAIKREGLTKKQLTDNIFWLSLFSNVIKQFGFSFTDICFSTVLDKTGSSCVYHLLTRLPLLLSPTLSQLFPPTDIFKLAASKIRGLVGEYPAILNISRTISVALM